MSDVLLELVQASKTYGEGAALVEALTTVDLQLHEGELIAVMGPSGSGKSTLLTLAGGLEQPTGGDVRLLGRSVVGLGAGALAELRRKSLGYVFQDLNLIPTLTAAENVSLPLELDGMSTKTARAEAEASLESVGLADLAARFPDELSGGQQQRVAIARALVGPRKILLADEPTGALDSRTGEDVLRVLRQRIDAGAAGILVTHEARHAAWADRVVFLRDGKIVDSTTSEGTSVGPLVRATVEEDA
ncbi:ABC transporter ATP-binding protein [soil metagenome]